MRNLDFYSQNFIENHTSVNKSLVEIERGKRRDNLFYLAISFFALCIILAVMVVNTYVFFIADVSGASMYPTLNTGDKLITNRIKEPELNSIVTIRHKKSNGQYELWIKRVVAVGKAGEQTVVEIINNNLYVNGVQKDEPYLVRSGITEPKNGVSRWVLKEDEIFFLGDNRLNSQDAREHGPCKKSDVVGVVEAWSLWLNDLF